MRRVIVVCVLALFATGCDSEPPAGQASAGPASRDPAIVARDNRIGLEIRNGFLVEKFRFSFLDVETNVVSGRVLLTGTVETGADRDAAAAIVGRVPGVGEIINELQIAAGGHLKDPSSDVAAERRIERQLSRVAGAKVRNYRWHSVNGVVYVIGIAQNRRELDTVVSAARRNAHAGRVVSHVRVR